MAGCEYRVVPISFRMNPEELEAILNERAGDGFKFKDVYQKEGWVILEKGRYGRPKSK